MTEQPGRSQTPRGSGLGENEEYEDFTMDTNTTTSVVSTTPTSQLIQSTSTSVQQGTSTSLSLKRGFKVNRKRKEASRPRPIKKQKPIQVYQKAEKPKYPLPPSSIHRINLKLLRKKFPGVKDEMEMIDHIVSEVNKTYNNVEELKFTKHDGRMGEEELPSELHGFDGVLYTKTLQLSPDGYDRLFEQPVASTKILKLVFFYRQSEIFVLTRESVWKIIQKFCCYEFPKKVSRRLTSSEGNYKVTKKKLVGNERATTSSNALPTLRDQVTTLEVGATKPLRPNASIRRLPGFGLNPKLRIGQAFIRFLTTFSTEHIFPLLNHLSIIASGGKTTTYPGNEDEKDNNDHSKLRLASELECEEPDEFMYKELYAFFRLRVQSLDGIEDDDDEDVKSDTKIWKMMELNHVCFTDFADATKFDLVYDEDDKAAKRETIAEFTRIPSAKEVLEKVRAFEEFQKGGSETLDKFPSCFKNVKIVFYPESQARPMTARLLNCLEFELFRGDQSYWRTMGKWSIPEPEYFYSVQKDFVNVLNNHLVNDDLLGENRDGISSQPWNTSTMKQDMSAYLKSYENRETEGYFVSPSTTSALVKLGVFDLLVAQRNGAGGGVDIFIYFIFDNLGVGLRGASVRVQKTLENVFVNKSDPEQQLEKFFNKYKNNEHFSNLFKSRDDFLAYFRRDPKNVHVVVAFKTGTGQAENFGDSGIPGTSSSSSTNRTKGKLGMEKDMQLAFTEENVKKLILDRLPDHVKIKMKKELQLQAETGDGDESLVAPIINRLAEKGYCSGGGDERKVHGNLLKLTSSTGFKFSQDAEVNEAVFEVLQAHFISQFPGFIHKLECIQIEEECYIRNLGVFN